MTTIALLRTTYLNDLLGRVDGSAVPWSDNACGQALTDAIAESWPDIGIWATGTVATDAASEIYTVPGGIKRVSGIDLLYTSGGTSQRIQKVTAWRPYSDTQVIISPIFSTDATLSLLFSGWKPYAITAADLPTDLESAIAYKAAALLFGNLTGQLVNSQRQQNLDSGRVVDYQSAVGLSAYWERRYQDRIRNHPSRVSYRPRHAHR